MLKKLTPHLSASGKSTGSLLALLAGVVVATGILFGQEAGGSKKAEAAQPQGRPTAAAPAGGKLEAAVAIARERAKLLHDVYSITLDVMHHRYFRHDGPVLPARAMEDVFEEMDGLSGDKANWISVNTKAMSINHTPATEFEKKAAAALATGKEDFELVGDGVYQRATPILLRSSCIGCHTKMFSDLPTTPRFAGLVISIPLKLEKK
ncbi:MAG: DUF3365 domain-containing protein [Prosthecobacter sp.]|nr:DUF3365 domain-containing protein [Prosthecobacter sp.]